MRISRALLPFCLCTFLATSVDARQRQNPLIYADSVTAELVGLARTRHEVRTMELDGYSGHLVTRVQARFGESRFLGGLNLVRTDLAARLDWRQPGVVDLHMLGSRTTASRLPGLDASRWSTWWVETFASEPWFSPTAVGSTIEFFGLPDEDAIHPFAADAERYYRYAIVDSSTITLPSRTVQVVAIRVEPRIPLDGRSTERRVDETRPSDEMIDILRRRLTDGRSRSEVERIRSFLDSIDVSDLARERQSVRDPLTLVSGELWLDATSYDVVRMTVTFVGGGLWDEDEESPILTSLEADLEYILYGQRHWLPYRQVIAATYEFKYFLGATLAVTASTTFSEHEVLENQLADESVSPSPVADSSTRRRRGRPCDEPWDLYDSSRRRSVEDCRQAFQVEYISDTGDRWLVHVPPQDSLEQYDFGAAFRELGDVAPQADLADRLGKMAMMTEQAASQIPGRSMLSVGWQRAAQSFRFNRVQGLVVGGDAVLRPGPAFTTLTVSSRFGFGDQRPMGSLVWRRDGALGQMDIQVHRFVRSVEPAGRLTTFGQSLKAVFVGHDDLDYVMTLGGGVTYRGAAGWWSGGTASLAVEQHRSVGQTSGSAINDFFLGSGRFQVNPSVREGDFARITLVKGGAIGSFATAELGTEALVGRARGGGEVGGGRGWLGLSVMGSVGDLLGAVTMRGGWYTGDSLPQMDFRAGGPETVRGFTYGVRTGSSVWSTQVDMEWVQNPWWSVVAFGDIGNTSSFHDPLASIGGGVSFLSGWVRFQVAKAITPRGVPARFDLLVEIPQSAIH